MPHIKPKIALIYDFDGTLSPGNIQEYNFLPQLGIPPKEFWALSKKRAKENNADGILSYMTLMLEKVHGTEVKITKKAFKEYGETVAMFPGVEQWFKRISDYASLKGATLEHYIISSGNKEMIEGTSIAKKFKKIYACSYIYDQHGVAIAPGLAINYTAKTQFLFRINKGILDEWENDKINDYMEKDKRPIPFERMIYFGDGATDVPCMKMVKSKGGHAIAVYTSNSRKKKPKAEKLIIQDRVSYVAPADYSSNKAIDKYVKVVIDKMIADYNVTKFYRDCYKNCKKNEKKI